MKYDYADIADRVAILKHNTNTDDRVRIRATLDGGPAGVQAVLSWGRDVPQQSGGYPDPKSSGRGGIPIDLPVANVMYSGLERQAQRIGRQPTLKTEMTPVNDSQEARNAAEKRGRIVRGWDEVARMELQYPQIGRWLPGYGFTYHAVREQRFGTQVIPVAELRDPFDVHYGQFGADQQPADVAICRHMSTAKVKQAWPEIAEMIDRKRLDRRKERGVVILSPGVGQWEGNAHSPIEVIEYVDQWGTHVAIPEVEVVVSYIPNPLETGPAFQMTKRFAFSKLQSHYQHAFGLMAMMGKLNVLAMIAAEDSVHRETNVFGQMVGKTYKRGRRAVNEFDVSARVEKPQGDLLNQTLQSINVLERQFRIVAGYDVSQDGISPNSFATGAAVAELGGAANDNVREYQTAIRHSVEAIDSKRLEWEEMLHRRETKHIYWFAGSGPNEETYVPEKDIAGNYQTKRIYGPMATFDENSKIVTGLQLMQAGALDQISMMEAMDGYEDITLMLERMDRKDAKDFLKQALAQQAMEKDPRATMALIEIMNEPSKIQEVLDKFFTPEGDEPSPEEQQMMAMMGAGGGMGPGGPPQVGAPPPVQTILSQIESETGGVQSVGRMA